MQSVWQYPRPPALVPCERRVRVVLGGETIADSVAALRVLETSHPPTVYVPPADIAAGALREASGTSDCEFKGRASYYDVLGGDGKVVERAAWTYHDPHPRYSALRDCVAFYPGRIDAAYLDDERVSSQLGDFYGGWITADVTGPFKGEAGTMGW